MIATIGRASAIGRIGPFNVVGSPAWLAWLLVHIVSLIGLRNRLSVLLGWTWAYLAWQDGARIITRRGPVIERDRFNDAGRPGAALHYPRRGTPSPAVPEIVYAVENVRPSPTEGEYNDSAGR